MIELPKRTAKPRKDGMNMIIEKGMDLNSYRSYINDYNYNIDFLKFTSGIGIIDPKIDERIELCHQNNIIPFFGGTLFEKFYLQNKVDSYVDFLKSKNIKCIEISDGTIEISESEKHRLISLFKSQGFMVMVEVGSKDTEFVMPPSVWLKQMNSALESGADFLIMEGRESGTAGLYRTSGEIRAGLLEEVCNSIDTSKIIFEAPNKKSQCFMINRLGANVNLGNIKLDELNILEVQRVGLRYETFNS